jgi:hypothetical protein
VLPQTGTDDDGRDLEAMLGHHLDEGGVVRLSSCKNSRCTSGKVKSPHVPLRSGLARWLAALLHFGDAFSPLPQSRRGP